jgi:hypothetical protein
MARRQPLTQQSPFKRRGPLGVKSAVFRVGRSLPVSPQLRTFSASVGRSQRCQTRKSHLHSLRATPDRQCPDENQNTLRTFLHMLHRAIALTYSHGCEGPSVPSCKSPLSRLHVCTFDFRVGSFASVWACLEHVRLG